MMKIVIKKSVYDEILTIRKAYNPNQPRAENGRWSKMNFAPDTGISGFGANIDSEVKYNGEYVLTKNGSKDFGEISPEIAKIIHRQAGKIRLRIGENTYDSENNAHGYGERHIERPSRLKQIQNAGYNNARDFVEDVSANYNAIYQGNGTTLILCKRDYKRNLVEFVQLKPSDEDDFYDVETTFVARSSYFKNKTPLYERNGVQ